MKVSTNLLGIVVFATLVPLSSTESEGTVSTVRDRLWIFTVAAGLNDDRLELGGVRGGSRMTPAEGAFWLGVHDILFIRESDSLSLPRHESWRAKSSFEQYAISFQPLDRVIWSVVGGGGKGGMHELPDVINLAKSFPNFSGIFLDDFITDKMTQPDGSLLGRPALQPDELQRTRDQLKAVGRPVETGVTLYTHEINPAREVESPKYTRCEPVLATFLDQFDVLTLWTWNSDEIKHLEANLAALEKIALKGARIALGSIYGTTTTTMPFLKRR